MELVSEEVERTNEITADWLHGSERASEREQEWERKKMTKFLLTDLLLFFPRPSGKMDTQRSKERKKARGRETRKDPFPSSCCQLRKYLSIFFSKYIYRLVPVGRMSQEVSLRKNKEKAMIVITYFQLGCCFIKIRKTITDDQTANSKIKRILWLEWC